jgi:hypothetical protein
MITAWCLTVALLTPWAVGAPVTWLIRGGRVLRSSDWLWAPFVGLAALVCILQPLVVFADVPLKYSAPWFVVGVASGWIALLLCRSGRSSVLRFPLRVAALSLGAALASGLGVLAEGVERYRGNMQSDQFHYVVWAQFVIEEPFSTSWPDVGQRPWLVLPVLMRGERSGQTVLHGFLALVAGRDALDLYFPTQLLGPALLCPAALLLANQFHLRRRLATLAAVAAALAPGTATLQSLCFLSQVLCVPVLVAFLAAVIRLSRGGGLRPLPYMVATFGLGFAVYTEFIPLFLGAASAALVMGWISRSIGARRIAAVALAVLGAAALAPAAIATTVSIWERSTGIGGRMTLGAPVPVWAACLWVNSDSAYRSVMATYAIKVRALVCSSFVLPVVGMVAFALSAVRAQRGLIPTVSGTSSLLIPPVLLWLLRPESTYMISKLLWTLTPILVLFAACAARALCKVALSTRVSVVWADRLAAAVFGAFVVPWTYHSAVEQGIYRDPGDLHTQSARVWNDRALTELCAELHRSPPTAVVLALGNESAPPSIEATALCYHGRHHRIWIISPRREWLINLEDVPAAQLTDLTTVPPGALVVLPCGSAPPHAGEIVFRNDRYEIIKIATFDRKWGERLRSAPRPTAQRPLTP